VTLWLGLNLALVVFYSVEEFTTADAFVGRTGHLTLLDQGAAPMPSTKLTMNAVNL
jgi:hypothetical protein